MNGFHHIDYGDVYVWLGKGRKGAMPSSQASHQLDEWHHKPATTIFRESAHARSDYRHCWTYAYPSHGHITVSYHIKCPKPVSLCIADYFKLIPTLQKSDAYRSSAPDISRWGPFRKPTRGTAVPGSVEKDVGRSGTDESGLIESVQRRIFGFIIKTCCSQLQQDFKKASMWLIIILFRFSLFFFLPLVGRAMSGGGHFHNLCHITLFLFRNSQLHVISGKLSDNVIIITCSGCSQSKTTWLQSSSDFVWKHPSTNHSVFGFRYLASHQSETKIAVPAKAMPPMCLPGERKISAHFHSQQKRPI